MMLFQTERLREIETPSLNLDSCRISETIFRFRPEKSVRRKRHEVYPNLRNCCNTYKKLTTLTYQPSLRTISTKPLKKYSTSYIPVHLASPHPHVFSNHSTVFRSRAGLPQMHRS
ncbi:hypothetical protein PHYBLDRAFT_138246 [Phycomyces blakesleeanus NRRL 1555(-)]|uniref:Uncharacterized protein n=1 Tax=Phycomyces blakesleeanus (strain ATCC 8743b / DSM 1359 / FGSC 10004 / NBRC 33097 / NRRL 1555) TaxID=763407 RepID=A0A163BCV2_PHYB8|nr:hypothetical protein PHYBLDRAFT_138246 [Phycomyces blakesleeanus NRRL 1555(-)]OAD80701.1 hypothetical protein PHYBLDRAFT_138246 [Phycomyces blakesleeanus NRRL 1555(-)]|eukprot:XP_018298741.1 hypothetical protein PHYBLDRAFT_138246 [Phycomyces blakesleeanus NRRL 1555(-)]